MIINFESRHCYLLDRTVRLQVRGNKGREEIKYICRTAREGNILACRMMRCKLINGGKGIDPFEKITGSKIIGGSKGIGG